VCLRRVGVRWYVYIKNELSTQVIAHTPVTLVLGSDAPSLCPHLPQTPAFEGKIPSLAVLNDGIGYKTKIHYMERKTPTSHDSFVHSMAGVA
jgi:hypothetical protein